MVSEPDIAREFFRVQKHIFDSIGSLWCEYLILEGFAGEETYAELRWIHLDKQAFLRLSFVPELALIQVTYPEEPESEIALPYGLPLADAAVMGPWLYAMIAEHAGQDLLTAVRDLCRLSDDEILALFNRWSEPIFHLYKTAVRRELPQELKSAARELMSESADTYTQVSESGLMERLTDQDLVDVHRALGKMFQQLGFPEGWRIEKEFLNSAAQKHADALVQGFFLAAGRRRQSGGPAIG